MKVNPNFSITNRMANSLALIEEVKGFLKAELLAPKWIAEMQNRAFLLESYHTTHIEGTQLSLKESEQIWCGKSVPEADPNDVKELTNYRKAFDLVADYMGSDLPVTEGLVRELHRLLVIDVRGNAAAPGEYRKIQNYVVNSVTGEKVYTPPPAYDVPAMMQGLVDYINDTQDAHPVLVSGVAQFQLVHIHPFLDGNGRTARLLSTLCLYRAGYDFKRLFTLSEYYDVKRVDYYRAIQSVRENHMDMTCWLEYFTRGLAEQLLEIRTRGEQALLDKEQKQFASLSQRQEKLFDLVVKEGSLNISQAEHLLGLPRRSLQRDFKALVESGLIISEGSTNRIVYKKK